LVWVRLVRLVWVRLVRVGQCKNKLNEVS